ncbi:MAG: DUF6326 family protein [Bacteroidota bacterium]
MNSIGNAVRELEDVKVPVKLKLAALWTAVMFCYIYGDFFSLFQTGKLAGMLAGKIEPLGPATQGVLLGVTISMAIPSVMIFLSLALKPGVNRWLNIIVGAIYTVFVLITMPGAWTFYLFLGSLDMLLTALIVWYAWHWPRVGA